MNKYLVFFRNGKTCEIEGAAMFCDNKVFSIHNEKGHLIALFSWDSLIGFIVKEGE